MWLLQTSGWLVGALDPTTGRAAGLLAKEADMRGLRRLAAIALVLVLGSCSGMLAAIVAGR